MVYSLFWNMDLAMAWAGHGQVALGEKAVAQDQTRNPKGTPGPAPLALQGYCILPCFSDWRRPVGLVVCHSCLFVYSCFIVDLGGKRVWTCAL